MVPAADPQPHVCSGQTCSMKGKPEAFLKELDRLTDTYPLERSALIQLATRPFPLEFAGQVQTADALHGRHGMTYPQLREMISNYTKTLTRKTRTTETPLMPQKLLQRMQKRTKTSDDIFEGLSCMLDRRYPQPSPVPNSFPAQTTSAITPPSTPATYPPRVPFDPRRDPHRLHPLLHQIHMATLDGAKDLTPATCVAPQITPGSSALGKRQDEDAQCVDHWHIERIYARKDIIRKHRPDGIQHPTAPLTAAPIDPSHLPSETTSPNV